MDRKILNELIGKMPKKNMIEMIELMVRYNSEAEQTLLDYCQTHAIEDNKDLVVQRQLIKHWGTAEQIIQFANNYGGCCNEDEETAYDEIELISDIVKENKLPWENRKMVIDGMIEQISLNNSGFTDMLVDAVFDLCQSDIELEYFADFLSHSGSNYYQGLAARMYKEMGKGDKYLDTLKNNLEYGSDYIELSKYYEKHGEKDKAIELAWEGLEKSHGRLDELYAYLFRKCSDDEKELWKLYEVAKSRKRDFDTMLELMYNYFKKKNRYAEYSKMLLQLLNHCDRNEVKKWYLKCKNELKAEDWEKHETEILKNVKDISLFDYLNICLEKNNTKEVLDYIMKQPKHIAWYHIDENHRFSKKLVREYPDEICNLYWQEVRVNIEMKNEKGYRHAVSVLKEIKKIMTKNKQVEQWNRTYAELLFAHKKKRLLMKIIDQAM